MSKEIAKGNVILQKEEELKKLVAEYKKTERNLKSNKTRLKNDREKIAVIQRKISFALQTHQEKIMDLQDELVRVTEKAKKSKKISKEDKGEISGMLDDIKSQMPDEEEIQRMTEEFAKERAKEDYERRLYERFHKQVPVEDQKSIRKIYIGLSKRFHPDLAKNDKELTYFNAIMVRANQAYESGDIAELLEIRKELADYDDNFLETPTEGEAVISFIQQKINKQTNELKLLKGQLSRTREELSEIRNSEDGLLLADYKRFEKAGVDMISQMEEEMNEQIEMLEMLIDNMDHYATTGEMSEEFQQAFMMDTSPFVIDDDDEFDFWDLIEIFEKS